MRRRARPRVPPAAASGTVPAAAGGPTGLRLIAAMLIAAAALDLTRCSLVLLTFRHVAPAVGLVAAGIGAAVLSVTAARGYRAGQRWAAWAALLIGVASAPQASASGFHDPYTIPDVATAALGVLLTVAILATAGRPGQPARHLEIGCVLLSGGGRGITPGSATTPEHRVDLPGANAVTHAAGGRGGWFTWRWPAPAVAARAAVTDDGAARPGSGSGRLPRFDAREGE